MADVQLARIENELGESDMILVVTADSPRRAMSFEAIAITPTFVLTVRRRMDKMTPHWDNVTWSAPTCRQDAEQSILSTV